MRFLFVSDRSPFPIRDGVTIPLAGYVEGFAARGHEVDVVVLQGGESGGSPEDFPPPGEGDRCRFYGAPAVTRSPLRAYLGEAFRAQPAFSGFSSATWPDPVREREYDVIWATPRRVLSVVAAAGDRGELRGRCFVAGVNDIWSAAIGSRLEEARGEGLRGVAKRLGMWIRMGGFQGLESHLLERFCRVVVQTGVEEAWALKISDGRLRDRVVVSPNGVRGDLFDLPLRSAGKAALFVGSLSGYYGRNPVDVLTRVWPRVRERHPEATLAVVGSGASPETGRRLEAAGIECTGFVSDIKEIYEPYELLLAPVFKGYGLINKVVEAMAGGCVAVGDATAFNGIPDLVPGEHSLLFEDEDELVSQVIAAFDDPDRMFRIKERARELMREHFSWEDRIVGMEEELTGGDSG